MDRQKPERERAMHGFVEHSLEYPKKPFMEFEGYNGLIYSGEVF